MNQPSMINATAALPESLRGKLTPELSAGDLTPAELAASLTYRATYLRRLVKVGSSVLTVAAALAIVHDIEIAAYAARLETSLKHIDALIEQCLAITEEAA